MKKILFLSFLSLTLACSSNNDGASNPNNTQKEFENPTGELTSANAKAIVNSAIAANAIVILQTPREIFAFGGLEFSDCTEKSGDTSTIDWDCVFNNITQCEADGETVSTNDSDRDFKSVDYAEFSVLCNENDADEVFIAADGDINTSRDNTGVYCANIEYSNDVTKSFNGCRNASCYISVRLDDKNVVVRDMEIDDTCSQITTTIRDKNKTDDVICDIQQTSGVCDGPGDILIIGNCQID
ncbi:MAG: hypothetical protein IT286_05315 [Proteobacteria bacterium]|nr:hypothetical protein [Pseudomonadota bacterium]